MINLQKTVRATALLFGVGLLASCGTSGNTPATHRGVAPEEDGTGSARTVQASDSQFVETVEEILQGKVAGVQVMEVPGCGVTVRIRGMSDSLLSGDAAAIDCQREPLLIIDNKPVALGNMGAALSSLTPHDIDKIRVLKDVASTSVYGTRAAYGVILITTKH